MAKLDVNSPVVTPDVTESSELLALVPKIPTSTEIQFARAALEHAFKLPSYTPSITPGWQRAGQAVGLSLIALFATSEGELNLAKLNGQVPGYVGLRDVQDGGVATEIMKWEKLDRDWSADQRGRFIVGAARLYQGFRDNKISEATFRTYMQELRDRVERQTSGVPELGGPQRTSIPPRQRIEMPPYSPKETLAPLPTPGMTTPQTRPRPEAAPPSSTTPDILREVGRENDNRVRQEAVEQQRRNQAEINQVYGNAKSQLPNLRAAVSNQGEFSVAPAPTIPGPSYRDYDGDGFADMYSVKDVSEVVAGSYKSAAAASYQFNSAARGKGDVQVTFSWSLPGATTAVPVTYRGSVAQVLKLYEAGIVSISDLERSGIQGRVKKEEERKVSRGTTPEREAPEREALNGTSVSPVVQTSVANLISRGASFSISSDSVTKLESNISTIVFYSGNPTAENLAAAKLAVQEGRKALSSIKAMELSAADRNLANALSSDFEKLAKQFKLPPVNQTTKPRSSANPTTRDPYEEQWEKFKRTYHDSVEEVQRTLQGSPYSGADVMRYADKRNVPAVEAARRLVDSGLSFGGTPPRIINGNTVASSPDENQRPVVLGRGTDSDVSYSVSSGENPRSMVSRRHAQINKTPDGFTIEDLGSTNGTWLNGNNIRGKGQVTLRPFDEVVLGDPNNLQNSYKFVFTPKSTQTQLSNNPFMNTNRYPSLQSLELRGREIGNSLASVSTEADRLALNNAMKNVLQAQLARFRGDLQTAGLLESKIRAYSVLEASTVPNSGVTPQITNQYEANRATALRIVPGELGRYEGNDGKEFSSEYIQNSQRARNDFDNKFWAGRGVISYDEFVEMNVSGHRLSDYKSGHPGEIRWNSFSATSVRPLGAEYTERIFQRYSNLNLGQIPDGKLSIEGIPQQDAPYSASQGDLRGRHVYPAGTSLKPYFEQGAKLLSEIREGLQTGRDATEVQQLIGKYYYVMVNARPFYSVNNSMYMNQVNYLLKLTGHPGLASQGDLDHLFMRVNGDQASKLWGEVLKGNFPNSRDIGISGLK